MAGTSFLPLVVEVAFGAGALDTGALTWTDISAHVKRGTGLDFSRGWDTESGEPIAGRLTLTVNNDDGDFTPGATGAYGLIRNRLPIRVSAVVGTGEIGTMVLWTGLVESWRITWENGVRSQVSLTCVDRWAAIRRLKFSSDLYGDLPSIRSASCYWKLSEAAGATRASATSGQSDLVIGNGTAVDFDALLNPSGISAVSLGTSGIYGVLVPATTFAFGSAAGVSLSFWFRTTDNTNISGSDRWVSFTGGSGASSWSLYMQLDTGQTHATWVLSTSGGTISSQSPATITGGTWAHLAVTVSVTAGTGTITAYVDGVADASPGVGAVTLGAFTSGYIQGPGGTTRPPYAYSQFAGWDAAITAPDVLLQYQVGSTATAWAGQTAETRAAHLVSIQSLPINLTTTGTFTSTMSKQSLVGKSLGEALMECAAAEAGALHIDTDGWPVLTSRSWRTGNAAAFTIPAHALTADVSWTLDDQQLCNSATVDRMVADESAGTVKATDDASVATYGEQSRSLSLWLHTDAQAIDRANAESHMFATPMPRSSDLSVDLLSKAATLPAATLLAAQIGDRVAVSGMPAEAPGETEFYIDSIADRVSASEWQRTFTVSPRRDFWTLQDATFGVIDSVYVLAY